MGITRTGSPGSHYSGDIILAFSVANKIEFIVVAVLNLEVESSVAANYSGEYVKASTIFQSQVLTIKRGVHTGMVSIGS